MHISEQTAALGIAIRHAEHMRAVGFNAAIVELSHRDFRVFYWRAGWA